MAYPAWLHPWLRIQLAIRTMLATRWGEQWPAVKAELGQGAGAAGTDAAGRVVELTSVAAGHMNCRRFLGALSLRFLAALCAGEMQLGGKRAP